MSYIILFKTEDGMRPYLYMVNIDGFKDLKRPVAGYDIFDRSTYGVKYFNTKKAAIIQLNKINKDKERFDEMVRNYPKVPNNISKIAIRTLRLASEDHRYGSYNDAKVIELPEIIPIRTNTNISIDEQVDEFLLKLWEEN